MQEQDKPITPMWTLASDDASGLTKQSLELFCFHWTLVACQLSKCSCAGVSSAVVYFENKNGIENEEKSSKAWNRNIHLLNREIFLFLHLGKRKVMLVWGIVLGITDFQFLFYVDHALIGQIRLSICWIPLQSGIPRAPTHPRKSFHVCMEHITAVGIPVMLAFAV